MFPKTLAPYGSHRLSDLLQAGVVIPFWKAGTILVQLIERSGTFSWPLAPISIFLNSEGNVSILPVEARHSDTVYQAPECRLSTGNDARPSAQVYGLCALLYHMLVGVPPVAEEPLAVRRATLREAIERMSLLGEAGKELWKILDRGLRLEPTRRHKTTEELKQELEGLSAYLNTEALQALQIRGVSGVYAGQEIPLRFPMVLGRQPGDCKILFPPDTPGVSRRHCRLQLVWGTVVVTDLGSTYGTALDKVPLPPWQARNWPVGSELSVGSSRQKLLLEKKPGP